MMIVLRWKRLLGLSVLAFCASSALIIYENQAVREDGRKLIEAADTNANKFSSVWNISEYFGNFISVDLDSIDHKSLWPLAVEDYIGITVAIIGLMLASGGGIGGGGILVPVYVLIMGFDPKLAAPLSNATILGGAVANMIVNNKRRHPHKDMPLVNWDLILMMEPPTIGGAIIGAMLSKVLPGVVIVICLIVLFAVMSFRSINTGMKLYARESRAIAKARAEISEKTNLVNSSSDDLSDDSSDQSSEEKCTCEDTTKPCVLHKNNGSLDFGATENKKDEYHGISEELRKVLEKEKQSPISKIMFITGFFLVTLALEMYQKTLTCGTAMYICMYLLTFVWIIVISTVIRIRMVLEWKYKKSISYEYGEGDVAWTPRNAFVYPSLCTFAGIFAGLFGIGGGIIKGPLMLDLGVLPQVASATSACMILFTSFTATASYLVLGLLEVDYASLLFVVGFVATLIGQLIVMHIIKKYKRASIIVLSIGTVIAISAVLLGYQSISSLTSDSGSSVDGFCDSST